MKFNLKNKSVKVPLGRCNNFVRSGVYDYVLYFLLCAASGCSPQVREYRTSVSHPVILSVARSGVGISGTVTRLHNISDMPPEYALTATSMSGVRPVTTLADLKGMVHIGSPADALVFVRFRTSLYTYSYFPGDFTTEILDRSEVNQVSDYGLPREVGIGGDPAALGDREFTSMGLTTTPRRGSST
jgi:hypothetical protein